MTRRRKPLLIGIVGGSGAGKSWLADKLQSALGRQVARLSLDDFYVDRSHLSPARRANLNFDHPRAINWAAFEQVLKRLSHGKSTRIPRYEFATHSRLRSTSVLQPAPLIVVDGLWLFHRTRLRKLFTLKVFTECSPELRLRRRIKRDIAARGRTRASVSLQFWKTVQPMHQRFVAPQAKVADVLIQEACSASEVTKLIELAKKLAGVKT